ncbi:unnamed protein product [Urochloa decumbens]|uniref:Uncharacterized protein n=1 Tax=Urochloa decumbens TaxID=240449 RepID=A0ABC9AXS6_9POAL
MELAAAALGNLLPKLSTLLSYEYKLQKGVSGEIRFLQAEMESKQAAIDKVSNLPPDQIDGVHKKWARDLKELVYDIEDSIDAFMVRVDAPVHTKPHSFRKFFDRTIGLLTKAKSRHHIADDIQDIKRRIQEVADRREKYKFEATAGQSDRNPIDLRVLACFEETANLVGTDGPAEKISNLLTEGKGEPTKKLMVVSIVGVGGLGKTTIANLVYERLGRQFDCQAFVPVSHKPDMKHIFGSILRQVSEDKCTNTGEKDLDELIRSIRKFLVDKRYLIVIDDIWNTEAWGIIKRALIDKNIGSRVILTTRNMDVAKFASMDGEVCELDALSYEDSRRLLCKRVFNEGEAIYSELEEITKKILNKCGGIPLAIITISSMLARINRTKYKWYGVYNSMGSGLEKDKTLDNMRTILRLSYSDLPYYLKPCLLYLSMFPEDYEIPRSNLVQLWVAEGFVVEKQGSTSYEIGDMYFNELVNRSMIMPVDMDKFGVATACRVHDVILDLIISLSAQENFCTIPDTLHHKSTACKIRRISLQSEQKIEAATANMSHVRSLIVFYNGIQMLPPMSRFSVLRVLSLENIPSKIIQPNDIGSLHHLRYLELGGELEPELLGGIGNLKLLKTLDLRRASIKELPACVVQLRQLEHLLTDSNLNFPDGIGNLTSLQELSVLNVDKAPNALALGKLTELRVLEMKGLDENKSYMETFLQSLSNLGNLSTFKFDDLCGHISLDSVSDQWKGPACLQVFDGNYKTFSELPRWFSSLSELSCLSIWVNVLRQADLQLLGALPMLRYLELQVHPEGTTDERLVIGSDQPFRSLAELKFRHFSRCWLVFGQGVMPRLRRLELYFNVRKRVGGGFDVGLENLTSLKHVVVQVDCRGARRREVEDEETKSRDAVNSHPNHPTLGLGRIYVNSMAERRLLRLPISSNLLTANDERKVEPGVRLGLARRLPKLNHQLLINHLNSNCFCTSPLYFRCSSVSIAREPFCFAAQAKYPLAVSASCSTSAYSFACSHQLLPFCWT